MIRALLKKQLEEIFRSYLYNPKKNSARSKLGIIAMFVLFGLVMVGVIGGMFTFVALQLCAPLTAAGMDWLYALVFGMIGIFFGTFGSVFNTFSGLYLGKDNDLLLAMPIPVRAILISRLLGVYLMGLMYSSMVCLPALIVYWIIGRAGVWTILSGVLWYLGITGIILILSCILGWAVAKISLKLKNRSFFTVLLALVFLGLYYFVYFKAQSLLQDLVTNAAVYGARIKGSARLLYDFGLASTGDGLSLAGFMAAVLVLAVVTYVVLSRSFYQIATASRAVAKVRYKEKDSKLHSVSSALLRRELSHFTHSPNYMLNCGLGIVFLPILAVTILIFSSDIRGFVNMVIGPTGTKYIPVIAIVVIGSLAAMIDTTPPSVSLEGKSLWIVQSLPVDPWLVLRAKLRMHLLLSLIPAVFCALSISLCLVDSLLHAVLLTLLAMATVFLDAVFGLFMGLKMPNLSWTNEIVPIKQSAAVAFAILGGMAWSVVFGVLFFLIDVDPTLYLIIGLLVNLALGCTFYLWLRKKGAARFAAL